MTVTSDILIDRTIAAIRRQGHLPKSPGKESVAGLALCAGALFVLESLAGGGPPVDCERLGRTILRRGGEHIVRLGRQFGLDTELVGLIVLKNDLFDDDTRFGGMIEFLRSLRRVPVST